jgi:translation initiation factor IF-3
MAHQQIGMEVLNRVKDFHFALLINETKANKPVSRSPPECYLMALLFLLRAKITLRFRGREMAHQQIGMEVLNRVKDDLVELAVAAPRTVLIFGILITSTSHC